MTAPIYATQADYQDWAGDSSDTTISDRLLRQASRVVDELLFGAVYAVDSEDYPTDTTVRQALRDATCAQAEWMDAQGDTSGVGDVQTVDSASIGSVSYSGASTTSQTSTTASGATVAPSAVRELQGAGLRLQVYVRG